MRKKLTPAKLRDKLIRLAEGERLKLEAWKNDRNPQVIEMYHRAEGRLDAWTAVIDALRGDPFLINIYDQLDEQLEITNND